MNELLKAPTGPPANGRLFELRPLLQKPYSHNAGNATRVLTLHPPADSECQPANLHGHTVLQPQPTRPIRGFVLLLGGGDPAKTAVVYCSSVYGSNVPFGVTENLYVALQHLRLLDRSRILWVDAICINQDDQREREAQVAIMCEIYSGASRVLVWLGPAAEDSDLAMSFLRRPGGSNPDHERAERLTEPHDVSSRSRRLSKGYSPSAESKTIFSQSTSREIGAVYQILRRPW